MEKLRRPAVEYSLTEHCNLACLHCNHASPLFPKKLAALDSYQRDVERLTEVLHADELRLVGGEPLLHPQLLDFLRVGRAAGIADKVVVYTNGIVLHRAPVELWELIDELWLSVYPGVERALSVEALGIIAADHGVALRPYAVDQFSLTLLNTPIDDPALVGQVFRRCKLAHDWSCHAFYEGRYYKCAQAPWHRDRQAMLGRTDDNREADGVALHGQPDVREALERYLASDTPLAACNQCLGTSGPPVPHRVLDAGGKKAWLAEDHRWAIEATRAALRAETTSTEKGAPRDDAA